MISRQEDGRVKVELEHESGTLSFLIDSEGIIEIIHLDDGLFEIEETEDQKWLQAAGRITSGITGLIKTTLHIDRAAEEVITARTSICNTCEKNTPCLKTRCCGRLGDVLDPTTCGCILSEKVKLATEQCPLGKW